MWPMLLSKIEPYLSWLVIGIIVIWLVYAGAVKPVIHPNPTTTQTGGVSNNYDVKNYPCGRLFSIDTGTPTKAAK